MHLSALVVLGLACFVSYSQADGDATFKAVTSGYCSKEFLKKSGVNPSKYEHKVRFDPKRVTTIPRKPKLPGCFRVVAHNVTFTKPLKQLTTEFEIRIANKNDPSIPTLKCKKKQPKCGCGEKDSCMYCDFCKNIKKFVKDAEINNKDIQLGDKHGCNCDVPAGVYSIDVEVCTPDEETITENTPQEVLDNVSNNKDFPVFLTAKFYDFRYNSLSNSDSSSSAAAALRARKNRGLSGCYILAGNVDV